MLASGISGKLFDVIKNIYEKSSVTLTAEKQSGVFTCNIGVPQGENRFCSPYIYMTESSSFRKKMQRIKRHRKLTKSASS